MILYLSIYITSGTLCGPVASSEQLLRRLDYSLVSFIIVVLVPILLREQVEEVVAEGCRKLQRLRLESALIL